MIDLYRFYDARGALLYVGISLHAAVRASAHRHDKSWWIDVARMDVEHIDTESRTMAELIEASVIASERPRHNVTHNQERRGPTPRADVPCTHRNRVWLKIGQFGWRRCTWSADHAHRHPEFGWVPLCGRHSLRDVDSYLRETAA